MGLAASRTESASPNACYQPTGAKLRAGSMNISAHRGKISRAQTSSFARESGRVALITGILLHAAIVICAAQSLPSASAPQNPVPASAPLAGALVSEWRGAVQVQIPGAPAGRPSRGQILPEGTTLDTRDGQMVLLLRADESEVLIQPHTKLVLHDPQPGAWDQIEILLGRVRAFIRKRTGGAPPFQMGTPSAVIAVRGTRFDVEVNRTGVSEVDVFEGLVEVGSATLPGVSVLVGPGMSTRVGVGSAPEAPVPTREIRPDVEVPGQMARFEFARERALQVERSWDSEFGEREVEDIGKAAGEPSGEREAETGDH
jgi:hypothetical protein